MEDAELVQLTLADPERGFAAIYEQYGTGLYNYCLSILRSGADAGDALQDSFLTVISKIAQLRDPTKLRPWLYAIARNQCYKRHRSRSRERPSDVEPMLDHTGQADSAGNSSELISLVWQATSGLSEIDRSVLELNLRHELDGEELAAALGVAGPKCSVMLHRAKDRLRTAVGALLVARVGTEHCSELAGIVTGNEFSPLVRKRVARHISSCAACEETERRHPPEKYLALIPIVRVPADVQHQVLGGIEAALRPTSAMSTSHGVTGSHGSPTRWRPDGFPKPPMSSKRTRTLLGGGAAAAAVVAIALLFGADPGRSETVLAGPAPAAAAPTTLAAPPPTPSSTPTAAPVPTSTPASAQQAAPAPQPTGAPGLSPTTQPPTATLEPTPNPTPAPTPTPNPTALPTPSPAPSATPSPIPTQTPFPTPTATAPATPTPTPTVLSLPGFQLVDTVPPEVTSFTLDCAVDPVVVFIQVADTIDQNPLVDLTVTWEGETDPGIPMVAFGDGYRALVPVSERTDRRLNIFVRGTIADASGNEEDEPLTDFCQFFD